MFSNEVGKLSVGVLIIALLMSSVGCLRKIYVYLKRLFRMVFADVSEHPYFEFELRITQTEF